MTSTDPFDGFQDNLEDLPTQPQNTDPETLPGKPRKVSNLQAHREQKERMAEINRIADETDFSYEPEWTPEACLLSDQGWHYEIRNGKRIWVHPDFGGWKGEDAAYYLQTHKPKGPHQ